MEIRPVPSCSVSGVFDEFIDLADAQRKANQWCAQVVADTIGMPLALTVLRGEALVDVVAVPVELSAGD
jgi:hypothetical protein